MLLLGDHHIRGLDDRHRVVADLEHQVVYGLVGPEGSSKVLLEGKANPLRLRQWTPLSDDELRMVDEGIAAQEELASKLADVPPPGRTALPRLSP